MVEAGEMLVRRSLAGPEIPSLPPRILDATLRGPIQKPKHPASGSGRFGVSRVPQLITAPCAQGMTGASSFQMV